MEIERAGLIVSRGGGGGGGPFTPLLNLDMEHC